jgi:(p)ppGpp synthase/HD superfamily hydrolase
MRGSSKVARSIIGAPTGYTVRMSPKHPLWQAAASLSARAHEHQCRKDGVTPYCAHPMRVALTCACVFGFTDEVVMAAALLHDVIEDAPIDYDDIHTLCGSEVADIVACLTKDMRIIEPKRERAYDEQLARGLWQARLIKLADVYDNLSEAHDTASRRTLADKAMRALALTKHDRQLAAARQKLEHLLKTSRSRQS